MIQIRSLLLSLLVASLSSMPFTYSTAQDTENLELQFESMLTQFQDVQSTTCKVSRRHRETAEPLSTEQLNLLRNLYVAATTNGYPNWSHLTVQGSHYWNIASFVGDLKPLPISREGILYVYQVPFDPDRNISQDWAWDSETDLDFPDIEVHIRWCRPLESGVGTRSSGSATFMVEINGEWKLYPP